MPWYLEQVFRASQRTPPTRVAMTIPLPMASALWHSGACPVISRRVEQLIGRSKPNVSDKSQIASPTKKPAGLIDRGVAPALREDSCKSAD